MVGERRQLLCVIFDLRAGVRPFTTLLVFSHKNVFGLRGCLPLFPVVIPALAVAVSTVVVVRLVWRIMGVPGAIVAPVSVEIHLAGLVLIPIFVGACLQLVVGMGLAGLHVVGSMAVVAPFLDVLIVTVVMVAIASLCAMPLQKMGVRYKSLAV